MTPTITPMITFKEAILAFILALAFVLSDGHAIEVATDASYAAEITADRHR